MDTSNTSAQIEELNCDVCKNSLAYFPIKIACENRANICGRCSTSENTIRNKVYETAAQFLQFSCRYKNYGCGEKMFPDEIPEHEKICLFQTVACPVRRYIFCDWEGSLPNVLQHCKQQHPDLLLKNGEFELNLLESRKCENFMEHEDGFLITTSNFSLGNNWFRFSISYCEHAVDLKKIYYQVSFKNNNKCLLMDGYANIFNRGEAETNEIFLHSLKSEGSDLSKVFVKITLEKTDNNPFLSGKLLNDEMLSQLKCSSCSDYVMPPIYQNYVMVWCADCNAIGIRNLNLDKLARLLNYPCKYWKNGCTAVSKPDEMVQHQRFCLKGTYDCPVHEYLMDCKWQGPGEDFTTHLRQNHADLIIANSSEITENFSSKSTSISPLLVASHTVVTAASKMSTASSTTTSTSYQKLVNGQTAVVSKTEQSFNFFPATGKPISSSHLVVTAASKISLPSSTVGSTTASASFNKSPMFNFSKDFPKEEQKLVTGQNGAVSTQTEQPFSFLPGTEKPIFNFASAGPGEDKAISKRKQQSFSFGASTNSSTAVTICSKMQSTPVVRLATTSASTTGSNKELVFEKCYVIPFLHRLFRLSFAVKNGKFYWAVQTIGNFTEKFKYELEIIDKNDKDRKLVAKQRCSVLTKISEIFVDKRHCCSFSVDDIKLFLSPQKDVTFKVQIVN